eukprot:GHVL01043943.1.p1 GENE.GHVL01043943.1~~GHVL01043943.1.p1  ORF type:complete len:150 (-),score=25.21 GHVL01043943.1:296-745(-)
MKFLYFCFASLCAASFTCRQGDEICSVNIVEAVDSNDVAILVRITDKTITCGQIPDISQKIGFTRVENVGEMQSFNFKGQADFAVGNHIVCSCDENVGTCDDPSDETEANTNFTTLVGKLLRAPGFMRQKDCSDGSCDANSFTFVNSYD